MIRPRFLVLPDLIFAASIAGADEFTGDIRVGWRDVSVSGSENKYRQHINLSDGGRLLGFRLGYRRDESADNLPDRVDVELYNLGGDPFESIHLGVRKYGSYQFRYDRRKSEYFYNDLIVDPALASITGSTGGDFHHFDFERVQDSLKLDLHFTPRAIARLNFDRYTKLGNSTTTRDIQRDEFELDQPIDETNQVFTAGFEYRWDTINLSVEERIREFDNDLHIFLPGFSSGENDADPTTLDFYFFGQPYGFDSNETQLRLSGRPNDRFDWRIGVAAIDLDLDLLASESGQGIDFLGNPFSVDESGTGTVGREIRAFDLEGSYLLNDRTSLTAAVSRKQLDQEGDVTFGLEVGRGDWDIDSTGAELGIQYVFSPDLTITVGWSGEQRDTRNVQEYSSVVSAAENNTDRDGFFARALYRYSDIFDLNLLVESNRIDDPFTLASPTDALRYRLRGRYHFANGATLSASHKVRDLDNDNSGWTARNEQTDLRYAYETERLWLSAGLSLIDLERDFDQLVTGGTRQDLFAVAYRADATLFDGRIKYRTTDSISIGGNIQIYDNNGSFATDRQDISAFVEFDLPRDYSVRSAYRNIDYNEDLEDYDADILEIAFGLDW